MAKKKTREEALNEMRRLAAKVFGDENDTTVEVDTKKTLESASEPQQKGVTEKSIPPVSEEPPEEIQDDLPKMPEIDEMGVPSTTKEPIGKEKKEKLNVAEEKIYLILTMLYRRIMAKSPNFQIGYSKWYKVLPEKLREYGLTAEEWTRISEIGDNDPELQKKMEKVEESL